jgi:DNA-binding NtrC family response regulator
MRNELLNPEANQVLVVDDEAPALKSLTHLLRKEGYTVKGCSSGQAALDELTRQDWDLIVTDLRMKGIDGLELLQRARDAYPELEVIVVTGHAAVDSAIKAMRRGAFDYLAKPYRLDEVRDVVRSALTVVGLKKENRLLKQRVAAFESGGTIITQDPLMLRLLDTARQIAPTGCNVVVSGESGTGKELLARFLHAHSDRPEGRFIGINCGAIQEDLLTNELFGHERGAFTGADQQTKGMIEQAHGGTLFLDEVTEMSPGMQVRLLRVLQERELYRVGGTTPIKVDVRVITATNRNLEEMVSTGGFRADLFYRLNVVNLELPPLRQRRDDIALLAYYFLRKSALAMGKALADIAPDALRLLNRYDFPGNVRELLNLIERGVALARGEMLQMTDLPENLQRLSVRVAGPSGELLTLEKNEASHIARVLELTAGNRNRTAEILGIDRVSLWRRIKRYGLEQDN